MSEILPTVKVVNADDAAGYMIINKTDFVEGEHTLYLTPEEVEAAAKADSKKAKAKADPAAPADPNAPAA